MGFGVRVANAAFRGLGAPPSNVGLSGGDGGRGIAGGNVAVVV